MELELHVDDSISLGPNWVAKRSMRRASPWRVWGYAFHFKCVSFESLKR